MTSVGVGSSIVGLGIGVAVAVSVGARAAISVGVNAAGTDVELGCAWAVVGAGLHELAASNNIKLSIAFKAGILMMRSPLGRAHGATYTHVGAGITWGQFESGVGAGVPAVAAKNMPRAAARNALTERG